MHPVYIVDSIRTPRARANQKGGLSKLNPYELLDFLYKDVESKNFFNLNSIDDLLIYFINNISAKPSAAEKTLWKRVTKTIEFLV